VCYQSDSGLKNNRWKHYGSTPYNAPVTRRLPAFQHGTQSIRLPQPQRRAEMAEIESFV
jgi:hypothetical protein